MAKNEPEFFDEPGWCSCCQIKKSGVISFDEDVVCGDCLLKAIRLLMRIDNGQQ